MVISERRSGQTAEQNEARRNQRGIRSESDQGHLSDEGATRGGLEFWGSGFRINPSEQVRQTRVKTLSEWEGKCDN